MELPELSVSGITVLGTDAVLAHQADEHVPLAAVAQGLLQEPGHHAVVDGPVGGLDDGLQDVVGTLHLVPEHDVALAELELLDVEDVAGFGAEEVEAGKHPAAAGAGLVGHAPVVQDGGEAVGGLGDDVAIQGDVVYVVLSDDVLHQLVVGLGGEVFLEAGHRGGVEGAWVGLGRHGCSLRCGSVGSYLYRRQSGNHVRDFGNRPVHLVFGSVTAHSEAQSTHGVLRGHAHGFEHVGQFHLVTVAGRAGRGSHRRQTGKYAIRFKSTQADATGRRFRYSNA